MKNKIFILFLLSISVLLCTSCGDDEYKDSTSDATLDVPYISASYDNGEVEISWGGIAYEYLYSYTLYMSTSYSGTYKPIAYDYFYSSEITECTFMYAKLTSPGTYYFKVAVSGNFTNIASVTIPGNSGDGSDSGSGGGSSDNTDDDSDDDSDGGSGGGSGGTTISRPSTPYSVSAVNEGNILLPEVRITWSSVSNATKYNIYRSSSSSSGYYLIGTSYYTYYSDWSPMNGKNYYKVTAVNDAGESSYSSYALFNYDKSSSLAPGTPTVTTSGTSSVSLSWSCPTGSNYGKATSYEVYKRNPENTEYELLTTTTSTRYTDSNTHPGYNRYAVVAVNSAGKSGAGYGTSESVSLSYPTSFSASKSGSYVKFSWSKVSKATGYQIFYSTSASGNYYILEDIDNANTTSTTVYYPASSGTKMYFKIKAYWQTSYGGGPIYSNFSSYKTVSF